MSRSVGAFLLVRTGQSQDMIAARLGVTQPAVAQWLSGATRPGKVRRGELLTAFEIPVESWDTPHAMTSPDPSPASTLDVAAIPDGVIGKAQLLEKMALEQIVELRGDPTATPLEKAKVMASVAQTLGLLAKLTGQFDLGRRYFELPVWKRIRKALDVGLASYPEAAAAVERELLLADEEAGS